MATCKVCGEQNPSDARYCNRCGATLESSSGEAVRKTVTVVFADVTGSTALGEQLDPESLREVLARFFQLAKGCVERHGGTVEKFIGDAVMAVFGVPVVHEDDAVRAVRAAAELRVALSELNEELDRQYGVTLQLRTGVNTGEVVAGTEERLATGDAVNVAARLEQSAQPGEILVGELTARLARGAIEIDAMPPLQVRGKHAPLAAFRLVRVTEGAPAFARRFDTRLVGRRSELARVGAAFDAAVLDRRCRMVAVLGPPGIGKSRLVREAAATLGDDAVVLTGRCLPYGDGITYWPLVEIFRERGGEAELAEALSAGGPEDVFWSVRKSLERNAGARPLALIVEDIHWAEPTLLDLLEHLVDWTRDASILLLCPARPEFIESRPGWSGRERIEMLTLEPLEETEARELIANLHGDIALEEGVLAQILRVSDGNPLFVEQSLAALAEGGEPDQVPSSIQALLAARLDALPQQERELVEAASVVGLEFEWEALAELSPDGRRPAGAQFAALVQKELIRPHETIADKFEFRHMLIRDAAYDRIPKERRANLHERFADWLDRRGVDLDEIVGYHLEQAHFLLSQLAPAGHPTRNLAARAAERLAAAGLRAYSRGDMEAATNLLERASVLLPPDVPARLHFLPTLGRALREAGRMDDADRLLAEAVERARSAGRLSLAADASIALADLRFQRSEETGVFRTNVLGELDKAIRVLEEHGDEAALGRALTLGGKLRFWGGESTEALVDLERAAIYASRTGSAADEADALQYVLAAIHRGPTPVAQALKRAEKLRDRAEGNRRLELSFLDTCAQLHAMQGRFEIARKLCAEATEIAEDHGFHVMLLSHTLPAKGAVESLAGDLLAAERALREACESMDLVGEFGFLASIAPLLADVVLTQGRHAEALALTKRWPAPKLTVPEDADAQAHWRRVHGKAVALSGDPEEGERFAREAHAIAASTDFLELRAHVSADLADVLRLAGKPDEADSVQADAIALFEQKGMLTPAHRLRANS